MSPPNLLEYATNTLLKIHIWVWIHTAKLCELNCQTSVFFVHKYIDLLICSAK